jgi:hypothetical protein
MPWHRALPTTVLALLALALGGTETPAAILAPDYLRVEIAGGATITISFTVTAPTDGQILAAESDCRCLAVTTPLPVALVATKPTVIEARVAGVDTGVESLVLRTTLGPLAAQVQVVTDGLGQGKDVLASILAKATERKCSVWFLVHDLKGQVRNCGCSRGSLGGINHLAALPAMCQSRAATVATRFLLTGDTDGGRAGVSAALQAKGWKTTDPALVVTANPASVLTAAGITAVVVTAPIGINHRRLVRPLTSGGMSAQALLIDGTGEIQAQIPLPIDATLDSDASILAGFPDQLSITIDHEIEPASDCDTCHKSAHKTWLTSRHAKAWTTLKPADRVDGCVGCHSTRVNSDKGRAIAPGVSCQACHLGSDAHIKDGGNTPTKGTVDCRSCHSALHHPGFVRDVAWKAILHGKDVKKPR